MKSATMPHVSRRITAGALTAVLMLCLLPTVPLRGSDSSIELGKTKSLAESQHEIVMLLMKKKEYQKAAIEAHKIFEMKWPEDQEPLLIRELLLISGRFVRQGQAGLSLEFIEQNSKCFKSTPSKIAILKEKGYLYKAMNQNEKAKEYFLKAIELEKKTD